jgi:Asp-tRNA(Asn)/Glu-tRNA(Gln) amidotransferase A subunit family amidase
MITGAKPGLIAVPVMGLVRIATIVRRIGIATQTMTEFAMLMSAMEAAEHVRATVSTHVDATKVSTANMPTAKTTPASKCCG